MQRLQSLVFLGTQSCTPSVERSTSCIACTFEPGSEVCLIDAGEGCQRELMKCGRNGNPARISKVRRALLTHLHGDHVFGLPGLMCTLGQVNAEASATMAVDVVGPPGTARYVRNTLMVTQSHMPYPYRVIELHGGWPVQASLAPRVDNNDNDNNNGNEEVEEEDPCGPIAAKEEMLTREFEGPWHGNEIPTVIVNIDPVSGVWAIPAPLKRSDVPEFDQKSNSQTFCAEDKCQDNNNNNNNNNKETKKKKNDKTAITKPIIISACVIHHRVPCVGYILTEDASDERTIDVAKARALGVPMGPAIGELKKHGVITLDDDAKTKITIDQVTAPPRAPGKISVLGDCSSVPEASIKAISGSNLLVHESTYDDALTCEAIDHGHSTPSIAGTVAKRAGIDSNGVLVLTHFSARYNKEQIEDMVAPAKSAWGEKAGTVIAANDGLLVDIPKPTREK